MEVSRNLLLWKVDKNNYDGVLNSKTRCVEELDGGNCVMQTYNYNTTNE